MYRMKWRDETAAALNCGNRIPAPKAVVVLATRSYFGPFEHLRSGGIGLALRCVRNELLHP